MGFRDDDRGVTVQVGAVLLFGILVISMATYQSAVVPSENKQVEFQHNRHVHEDLQSFRSAVTRSAGTGLTESVAVRLGTLYPARTVFINPPPPTGTLRTSGTDSIEIRNAKASDSDANDYWNGTDARRFTTKRLVYDADYRVYQNAPTAVYESGVLYSEFVGVRPVLRSGQSLVDGRQITLVALDGNLSRSHTGSVAIDVRPKSVSERSIAVSGDGSDNLTVLIPSALDATVWNDLLADEVDSGGDSDRDRYVQSVTEGPGDTVQLVFEPGYTYDLTLAKVSVGTDGSEATATYLTKVSGNGTTVPEGSTQRVVVEARDEFNNPISGQAVTASIASESGSIDDSAVTTGRSGRASFAYSAPDDVDGSQSVTVTAGFGTGPKKQVRFDLTIADSDGSGGGGSSNINPSGPDYMTLEAADITGGTNGSQVGVTFNNTGSADRTIHGARFNFYSEDSQNGKANPPKSISFDGKGILNVRGSYVTVNRIVSPGNNTLSLRFYRNRDGSGGDFDVDEGDFFVLTVQYDSGRTATYFISPSMG